MTTNTTLHTARKPIRSLMLGAALGVFALPAAAQQEVCQSRSYTVEFEINSSGIDLNLAHNRATLDSLVDLLRDPQGRLESVRFIGRVSPDGSIETNRRLADERAWALTRYVRLRTDVPDSLMTVVGEDVDLDALRPLIEADPNVPGRKKALEILAMPGRVERMYGNLTADWRLKELKWINRGRTWAYIAEHILPPMRQATSIVVTCRMPEPPAQPEPHVTDAVEVVETVTEVVAEPVAKEKRPWYVALKTNMLYDVLAVPNIGAEVYLGKNFTVGADWMYAFWGHDTETRIYKIYGGDLYGRYYFGPGSDRPLHGMHAGVFGQMLAYDLEFGNKGWQAPRWTYGGGVEFGWTFSIGPRLNIDLNAGFGLLHGIYKDYIPVDGHFVWQATKMRNYFGPTQLEVQLEWLIGRGNTNRKPKTDNQ